MNHGEYHHTRILGLGKGDNIFPRRAIPARACDIGSRGSVAVRDAWIAPLRLRGVADALELSSRSGSGQAIGIPVCIFHFLKPRAFD